VNARVRKNTDVTTRVLPYDQAVEAGAMALFGEKYGEEVRVLAMGGDEDERFSVELCGGTHVRRTGDIGFFKIVGETALAAGVRRIEAVTGAGALAYVSEREAALRAAADTLRTSVAELPARISQLVEERKRLERELSETRRKLAAGGGAAAVAEGPKSVAGITLAARKVEGVPAKELKGLADELRRSAPTNSIIAIVGVDTDKASVVVSVSSDLTNRFSAVDFVRTAVEKLGGKGGGGRPDMAQGGGPDPSQADAALAAIEQAVAEKAGN
jgi:alanyl-tRNA synthetase